LYLTFSRGGIIATVCGVLVLIAVSPRPTRLAATALAMLMLAAIAGAVAELQGNVADGPGTEGGLVVLIVLVVLTGLAARFALRPPKLLRGRKRGPLVRNGATAGLAVLVATVGIGAAGWALDDGGAQAGEFDPTTDLNVSARLLSAETQRGELWDSAIEAFAESPIQGIGAGSYEFWLARDDDARQLARDAHSLPLETVAELGLPGFLLLTLFVGALARAAWRAAAALKGPKDDAPRAALLAMFALVLIQATVDWTTDLVAVAALGFGGALVLAASASGTRSRVRGKARYALAALCVLVAAVQVPGLVSADRIALSERALALGMTGTAMEAADDAVTAEPWSADARAQRSEVYLALGDLEAAEADVSRAIELEPTNWSHAALAGRVAASADDAKLASSYFLLVAELRPGIADLAEAFAADPSQVVPTAAEPPP
jgi:tetratricopeptide (TPR) repeat protein